MNFPVFDSDNIEFAAVKLDDWLKSLPEGTKLRVCHTESDHIKMTWLCDDERNIVFAVSETQTRQEDAE
jgi:hypothetical protein